MDLIDSMLVVNPDRRFTVEQCLSHPWLSQRPPDVNDSTCGLVGGVASLEVNRRGPVRERTLLASLNSVHVAARVAVGDEPVKVFSKNQKNRVPNAGKEQAPDHERTAGEFMCLGGKGDQQLFGDEEGSVYGTGAGKEGGKGGKKVKK